MSFLKRLRRKVIRPLLKVAAPVALGFALGPPGVGVGARILGGFGKIGRGVGKVLEATKPTGLPPLGGDIGLGTPPFVGGGEAIRTFAPRFTRLMGRVANAPPTMTAYDTFAPEQTQAFQPTHSAAVEPFMHQVQALPPRMQRGQPMSLLTDIRSAANRFFTQPLPYPPMGMSRLPPLPGAGFRTGGGFPGTLQGNVPVRGLRFDPRTGTFKKIRRINPTNVKALRRALRRVEGFIKIEKRVDKIVQRAGRAASRSRSHGFVRKKR